MLRHHDHYFQNSPILPLSYNGVIFCVVGCAWRLSLSIMFSSFSHAVACIVLCPLLWPDNSASCQCTASCLPARALMNTALLPPFGRCESLAMNIGIQVSEGLVEVVSASRITGIQHFQRLSRAGFLDAPSRAAWLYRLVKYWDAVSRAQ